MTIDFHALGETTVVGGATPQSVYMNNGPNLYVSNAQDTIITGTAPDTIITAAANDLVYGNGALNFFNGTGDSTVIANGQTYVEGGSGTVAAYGGALACTLNGGSGGHNTLIGGAGTSILRGYGANNVLVAASGNTSLFTYSTTTNESLYGGSGSDYVSTGDGTSTFVVGGSGGMLANIGANTTFFCGSGAGDSIHGGGALTSGAAANGDTVVGFRQGVDSLYDGSRQLSPTFTNGFFQTTLSDGVQLYVFAHS